jgi:hypothetical protein
MVSMVDMVIMITMVTKKMVSMVKMAFTVKIVLKFYNLIQTYLKNEFWKFG